MRTFETPGRTEADAARGARLLLLAVNVSVIVAPIGYTLAYSPAITTPALGIVPVALGLAIAAVHGRNTLAATRGQRPMGAVWLLALLALLIYPPLLWIGLSWGITQTTLIASAMMVLPRRAAIATVGAVLLAVASYATYAYWGRGGTGRLVFDVAAALTFDTVVGLALFGAARLVWMLYQVAAAQAELAAAAAGKERIRVSRDLHDLLGQSLSAVALKGDLALRLVQDDRPAARSEVRDVAAIARNTLSGMRAVTRDHHVATLPAEVEGSAALLRVAGVRTTVEVETAGLSPAAEAALAWAVREGVTNVLRHSRARVCSLRVGQRDNRAWLEIVNDGVSGSARLGTGLTGLAERAKAASGSLSSGLRADGSFRLFVELAADAGTIKEGS